MNDLPFFQVDAFADAPFTGNPAAVMPLDTWLDDDLMQKIAAENNLSETAFLVERDADDADYDLRWFTPTVEVRMCGHATMASAHVLMGARDRLRFRTKSGILVVERDGDALRLDLPAGTVAPGTNGALLAALGLPATTPLFLGDGGNGTAIILLDCERQVRALAPDFAALKPYDLLVNATAPGDDTDIVSRVFAAYHGIDEDPVTGSAHASLVPFWADRLGKTRFTAFQASARGGRLDCALHGDRVILGGRCRTMIEGRFKL